VSFLSKPAATLAALAFGILVFGTGLTSPIWLIVVGENPIQAMQSGLPIVVTSIVGLAISIGLGVLASRLRKPMEAGPVAAIAAPTRNHALVHVVVMLMFVIPFLTIILGYLLRQMIDFDAG
jgi:hypothetical protein